MGRWQRQENREDRWAADDAVAAQESERQRREELAADRRERLWYLTDVAPRIESLADKARAEREAKL